MSNVKELIDEYAAENSQLRQQAEMLLLLLRDITVMHGDEIRITEKIRRQADKFGLEIKHLKTSVILKVKEKVEE